MHRFILTLSFFFFSILCFFAQENHNVGLNLSQSSQVSLLTCSPNDDAIYAVYGHSALRVKDDSLNIDYVFDYGVFNFEESGFIFRFVKGETDYMVVCRSFFNFFREYNYRGSGVKEQIINFTNAQKNEIANNLFWNALPENRTYRYNFVENNCSTKPEDLIIETFDNKIIFNTDTTRQTYRDIFNEYLVLDPWYKMGINLVIGSYADTIITSKQKNFAPQYLFNSLEDANLVQANGKYTKAIEQTQILLKPQGINKTLISDIESQTYSLNIPLYVGVILFLSGIVVTLYSSDKNKRWAINLFDILLFSVSTTIGLIIFYLMFFSTHPCVGANWNLVWLNPLIILIIPFFVTKLRSRSIIWFHFINFALITLFLLCIYFIPQVFELSFFFYIILLWFRSGNRLWRYINKKKYK